MANEVEITDEEIRRYIKEKGPVKRTGWAFPKRSLNWEEARKQLAEVKKKEKKGGC